MSKIILSVVFFVILMPVGLFRRIIGKDSLKLKQFKKGKDGVMLQRNHRFTSNDIVNPF
jgi:hypothetical protein